MPSGIVNAHDESRIWSAGAFDGDFQRWGGGEQERENHARENGTIAVP